ncbi:MAG: hypothetical protein ACJAW2_001846 [Shewanella sp.]|jgi:hypothetical protein
MVSMGPIFVASGVIKLFLGLLALALVDSINAQLIIVVIKTVAIKP